MEDKEEFLSDKRKKVSKKSERSYMTKPLRYLIIKESGGRCALCGRSIEDGISLHVDHILPIAKGGKTVVSNLRVLCDDCNIGKGALDPEMTLSTYINRK